MPLFQASVLKKYISQLDKPTVQKAYEKYCKFFHDTKTQENIRNSKEEQFQEGFLRELFVDVLGYTLNPTPKFNLTTELKNIKDSKKADGAIIIDEKVKAVIELKGTNTTDLGKIETQAFGYKNNQLDCVYVITSNFEKIRFYIDNAIEFLEFNLFQLTQTEFEILYLCLAYDNLSKGIAKTAKDESVSQEDVITKKLYKDYSLFKRELHQNLVALNPQYEPIELFKKSQKLLDRFLFIFFAEDRNLLPTNLIFRINKEWQNLRSMRIEVSLYDRYKIYFNDLNSGAKVQLPAFSQTASHTIEEHQIFAYNGGLFKADDILDNIKIDDAVLFKHTENLSNYDFASEVDVNILGHIFENSLNELDEITNEVMGLTMGLKPLSTQVSKRKKDGVFYTPKYITKYIVENTIGKLCEEKKTELQLVDEEYTNNNGLKSTALAKKTKQILIDKVETYRSWLLQLTICDPACGSGAFLNQALDFLIAEHQYIDELKAKLFGDTFVLSDIATSILENNLFGVDLNEESVEIAKLSLWLRTAQPNRKLNDLSSNIQCGNSLIDDVAIAGDKAFNWQTAFPNIFKEKNKKVWHITTAIHDSRTSQRMNDYKVREKRDMGTNPLPNICYLEPEDEEIITKTIAEIVEEQKLNLLQYNICQDHMHIVLVCNEEEVPNIMQKIKGKTARVHNSNKGINPLVQKENEKSVPLWTQKYGCKEITSPEQLHNTIEYVKHNRNKHNLPAHGKKTALLLENMLCTQQKAFEPEYTGGFDVIIGNPPYGVSFNEIEKKYLSDFDNLVPDFEIYIYFISLYKVILNKKGLLSYIFPNTFLSTLFGKKYREVIFNDVNVYQIIDLSNDNTFIDASVRTCIFTFENAMLDYNTELIKVENSEFKTIGSFAKTEIITQIENISSLFFQNKDEKFIIDKLQKNKYLKEFHEISQGLIPYDKYRGHDEYTIKNRIWHSEIKKDDTYKKELKGADVNRYNVTWNGNLWISYGDWLAAPRNPLFFTKERILVREIISKRLFCGFTNEEFYNTPSCINIIDSKESINLRVTLSILNSKLIGWYCNKVSPKANKGLFPKILVNDIRNIPLVEISKENQQPFIEKADLMLSLNKTLQQQQSKVINMLQRDYGLTKPTKKLETWYELSLQSFFAELAKAKIVLSAIQKDEVQEYFETYQKQAVATKDQIIATDKQIDAMVYELYGLSNEEIAIVESSN